MRSKRTSLIVAPWLLSTALVLQAFAGFAGTLLLAGAAEAADNQHRPVTRPAKSRRKPTPPSSETESMAPSSSELQSRSGTGTAGAGGAPTTLLVKPGETLNGPEAMRVCVDSWDKDTQMSPQEWRESCVRTLREYPIIGPY
jgi:hypothetical protein